MYKYAIILAAGEGKRMKSSTPKVLHKVCGKEMVNHVIDTMRKSGIDEVNVVIGKGADKVKVGTESRNVSYSFQDKQLGTGHAILCNSIRFFTVLPLIRGASPANTATILTSLVNDPTGYGRIIRNNGSVEKIVEHKDCNEKELKVNEINSAIYTFDIKSLLECLDELKNDNAQGEYYLTDVIGILKNKNEKVGAMVVDFEETLGVNSKVQLAQVENILKNRINKEHMENGVTIIDPNNTYIGADVTIEQDVIIYPNNILEGATVIKTGAVIYQNCRIKDSVIEKEATIESSVILDSKVGEKTTVGPFAYIRPESTIGNHVKIGDFVEIKKSFIGDNTKVSHLTYIGDAEVGTGCNFGCGTVVVNYDGKKKNKTIIGNNAFIGCNTNLVSPVEIKDNAYTAAGSTITKEVPEGSLSIARAKQVNIEGWVDRKGLRK